MKQETSNILVLISNESYSKFICVLNSKIYIFTRLILDEDESRDDSSETDIDGILVGNDTDGGGDDYGREVQGVKVLKAYQEEECRLEYCPAGERILQFIYVNCFIE